MAASMFLARTSTMIASVDCALGPLWNPVRLAEDIALVDNMSRGRLHTTVGLGYRTVEYRLNRSGFQSARQADGRTWSSECCQSGPAVIPMRESAPVPGPGRIHRCIVGGGSRATARRAARFGSAAQPGRPPARRSPTHYRELCAEAGIKPFVIMPGPVNRGMIFLHEDPDRAWAELGEHILWEAVTYGGWSTDERSLMHLPGVRTLEEVKASGRYRFLTPDQLIAEVRERRRLRADRVAPAGRRHAGRRGVEVGATFD